MGAPNQHAPKVVIVLFITFLSLPPATSSANAIVSADDVNGLAQMAMLTFDAFMQESLEPRLAFEFSGKFSATDDREKLREVAKRAGEHLQAIAEKQGRLKQKIEDYNGRDWDNRYGSTGLWRKLFADLHTTILSKCEVDFYFALTVEQPKRNSILRKILAEIKSLELRRLPADSQLLKARTLALLAQADPTYKSSAKKEFDALMVRSDMQQTTAFRAAIERIKLLGQAESNRLKTLTEELAQSSCADDLELVLSLAFLQRRLDRQAFEKTLSLWPQTEDFIGSLILSDLSGRIEAGRLTEEVLEQTSVLDAELAAQAAWKTEAKNHKRLLDAISNKEKFQTPLILYVTAVASAQTSPAEAVNLLIKASTLQWLQKSDRLGVEAGEIAKQAAQLAYNLFAKKLVGCEAALQAFENYDKIAANKMDEELEYLYTIVLNDCDQTLESKKLLGKIADRPAGTFRDRAKLDVIVKQFREVQDGGRKRKNELLEELRDFILNCHGQDKNSNSLGTEAITIYCQSFLDSQDKRAAQEVLTILETAEVTQGVDLNLFKARALRQSGRLEESAHFMLLAIGVDSDSLAGEVMKLLSEVVDSIDRLQVRADNFGSMMQNCKKLAEFCYKSAKNPESGLYLAEISIFAAGGNKAELSEVERLLNELKKDFPGEDLDLLRCRARLLTGQGKFEASAGLWAKICSIRKNQAGSASRPSRKWWRAKFYELDCWSKMPQTEKKNVLHTIEILENSFADIPPLWAEKLESLKRKCQTEPATQVNSLRK